MIESNKIESQQDIIQALTQEGISISQSTLSKDLKEMGVIKIRGKDGKFKFIQTKEKDTFRTEVILRRELMDFLKETSQVGNLVLLKTVPGNASGISRSVDEIGWKEIAGTLASVDTVLVVTYSANDARKVVERVQSILLE